MDAAVVDAVQRLSGAVDVGIGGTGKATDATVVNRFGNRAYRLEITRAGVGKTGLDDIDPHPLERPRDPQFLLAGHGRAGALLAVA